MSRSIHVRLTAHPNNPPRFHQHIEANLSVGRDGGLQVAYTIHGLHLDLRIPTPHAPAQADALWKSTCCELFLAAQGKNTYREFNFSPSGQWAAYEFTDTRQIAPAPFSPPAPHIEFERSEDLLKLIATLPGNALPTGDTLHIAVSTILEADGGHLAYWALAHPPGKPDFHHHAGFVLSFGTTGFRPSRW